MPPQLPATFISSEAASENPTGGRFLKSSSGFHKRHTISYSVWESHLLQATSGQTPWPFSSLSLIFFLLLKNKSAKKKKKREKEKTSITSTTIATDSGLDNMEVNKTVYWKETHWLLLIIITKWNLQVLRQCTISWGASSRGDLLWLWLYKGICLSPVSNETLD